LQSIWHKDALAIKELIVETPQHANAEVVQDSEVEVILFGADEHWSFVRFKKILNGFVWLSINSFDMLL
jgi:hypothetical protein